MKNPDSRLIIVNIIVMVLLALSIVIIGYKVTQKLNEKTVDTVITKLKSLNWEDVNKTVEVLSDKDFKQALTIIKGIDVDQVNSVLNKFKNINVDDITNTVKQGLNAVIGDVEDSWSDIQKGLKTVNRISNDLDDNTITSFKNIINSPSVQTISKNLCDPINIPIKAGFFGKLPVYGPIPQTASTVSIKLPGCSSKTNFDFEDEYDFY
jgi:hypothetical protein